MSSSFTFPTYRDEFDPHLTTHMPLSNIMNLFERARSNMLGGPDALRRLQCDHGILTVITGFTNLALIDDDNDDNDIDIDDDSTAAAEQPLLLRLVPGKSAVTIDTGTVVKRRGTLIECSQTASLVDDDNTESTSITSRTNGCDGTRQRRRRIAQGVATLLAIDAVTKRPVSRLPDWVLLKIRGCSSAVVH